MNGPAPCCWSRSTGPFASNETFLTITSGDMSETEKKIPDADAKFILRELAVPVADHEPDLSAAIASFLRVKKNLVSEVHILRKSLDSRRRNQPLWRYSVEFTFKGALKHPKVVPAGLPGTPGKIAPAATYRAQGDRVAV